MKKISIIILGLLIYSCQFNTNQNESNSSSSSNGVNLKNNELNKEEGSRIEQPNKIVEEKQKISKSIYIIDSIKLELDFLIDTVSKYNPNMPVIYPAEISENLKTVFQLNDSMLLISFFIDSDFEVTRFIKWKLTKDSILKYQGRLKPDFMTKYAYATILEQISINQNTILIGEISGGEGGENWQSLWVSQLTSKDSLIEIGQYKTEYESDVYMRSLEYEVKGNDVLIYEKTDSTNYTTGSLVIIPISKKLVKAIKLR